MELQIGLKVYLWIIAVSLLDSTAVFSLALGVPMRNARLLLY